jgi:hypothetical protein
MTPDTRKNPAPLNCRRGGVAAVYLIVALTALVAISSLAADNARVQRVRAGGQVGRAHPAPHHLARLGQQGQTMLHRQRHALQRNVLRPPLGDLVLQHRYRQAGGRSLPPGLVDAPLRVLRAGGAGRDAAEQEGECDMLHLQWSQQLGACAPRCLP